MRSVGLFDETAASVGGWRRRRPTTSSLSVALLHQRKRRHLSLCFFPLLGERRDISQLVALFDDKATSLSVAVVEEGQRRSLSVSFLSSAENGELCLRRIGSVELSSIQVLFLATQDSSTSQADSKKCPPGVKASKASGKKTVDHEKTIPAEVMADLYSCITGEWRGRQDHERVESQTRRRESGVRQDRVVLYCLVHGHKMTQ
ncbi:hypothetical protein F2Q70_00005438 [Brassica cretica]|uniref:Uncharacterized protein n=1 Tax=Brassica cretica TaxID=69181 RepID=A0A8S9IY87_BRACR|nr:hypothetical protein F2Q70_00005438 [Brassica cretica]